MRIPILEQLHPADLGFRVGIRLYHDATRTKLTVPVEEECAKLEVHLVFHQNFSDSLQEFW